MHLEKEEIEVGKANFLEVLGSIRGDFLQKSLAASEVGPYYFGYEKVDKPVKAGIVGTGNEGCEAMIKQSSPAYLEYVAYHDIRPTQIARGRKKFEQLYGKEQGSKVKFYDKWQDMLADKEIEAIVVATPLWTHAQLAIDAMNAGKHVLCEKLMAHNIADGKRMVRTADEKNKVLSVGHQRHYSALYDNAMAVVHSGVLGDIHNVRALWHRNNTWPALDGDGMHDSWSPDIPEDDASVDFKKYGYKSLPELIRWRLYDRTGGGLMAELGSHQLDACSLFLKKVRPISVQAVGGKHFYDDNRECEDHVYCMYEMPGGIGMNYATINTNSREGYGEIVTGTKGTLLVMNEKNVMLFKERERGDKWRSQEMHVDYKNGDDQKLIGSKDPSIGEGAALARLALDKASQFLPAGSKKMMNNRGYHEEIEAFAHAIRNPDYKVRCDGRVALADAVMALSTNVAMRNQEKIAFEDSWYDPKNDAVPENKKGGGTIAKAS
ncbi:Glucose--fructose oxidoreductase precursor [Planctomycetes bacterium Pan216]|uniref:Glucose--fructose oxidoreductase n=1 Tax=Kolteria novifilia TaxID=2527975 RepID=A0A518AXV4_9BACT|nr:Glucose--fructose oxidoreductase precursor [Planctomycetes bacterium Pan216]